MFKTILNVYNTINDNVYNKLNDTCDKQKY